MAEQKISGMQIYYTLDLSVFKEITSNREVNLKHVKKLILAIKKNNLLRVNPILVDRKMNVIDGQHRLEAARQLQEGIYYIVDEHVSQADIASLNTNMHNWTPADYVNYWAIEKALGFDKVTKVLSVYPWLNVSNSLYLLSVNPRRDSDEIKEGKIDVSNFENAIDICNKIEFMANEYGYKFIKTGLFLRAFRQLNECDKYNHDHFLVKLALSPRSFFKCATSKEYIEQIEEIYNKQLHEKNKIYFTKLLKK